MRNLALTLAYDGTDFFGWQKTSMGPSIEQTLQTVLQQILQHEVVLQAASRTDRGVHAEGQVVNFFTPKTFDVNKLRYSLHALLPKAITVLAVEEKETSFHPTLDVQGKEYVYTLCCAAVQLPQHRFFSWHVPATLDMEVMRQAARHFIGERDFSPFCNQRKDLRYPDKRRHVKWIEFYPLPNQRLQIAIAADHFLYKMARNIIGTLIDVGRGRLTMQQIMQAQQRAEVGLCAPAHGLCLKRVFYSPINTANSMIATL